MKRISQLVAAAVLGVVAAASIPAAASAAPADKPAVLASWTQTSVASFNSWNAARQNQGAWSQYAFDWSTDYCTSSPDNPLGFDFRLPCYRHDFGYRNYKAAGQFDASKSRLDNALYQDLLRACDAYEPVFERPACDALAWTYYQAVRVFGFTRVTQADLDRAADIKAGRAPQTTAR
jgi:hypothetical protein